MIKTSAFALFTAIALLTTLPACKKENTSPPVVYIAGNTIAGPQIWKNGTPTLLPGTSAIAKDLYVSGADVYVAGYRTVGGISIAQYWKNGTVIDLSNGIRNASATGIFVSGSDVYVSGYEYNGFEYIAKYWKNGVAVPLSNAVNNAYAKDIFVKGNDIYVAGDEESGTGSVAKYWKNGVETILPHTLQSTGNYTNSIFVEGNTVYVTGYCYDGTQNLGVSWKNGISELEVLLVNSVCVSGGHVYMAASQDNGTDWEAKYLKNGTPIDLSDGTEDAWANTVFVHGNDVYTVGRGRAGAAWEIMAWKNDVPMVLTNASSVTPATSAGIFVQ